MKPLLISLNIIIIIIIIIIQSLMLPLTV